MAKIERKTQKIFSGNAPTDELAVFGTMSTGNPIYTDNIEDLQSAAYEEGWSAAITANEAPFLEEMNGVQYGLSKQIAYNFQEGIAEYDSDTTYYKGSIVKTLTDDGEPQLYYSLTDDNIGNPLTDDTKWKKVELGGGGGLEIGDVGIAALGIDETKGLRRYLNGTVLTINANTKAFVEKLKSAANLYPNLVCSESEWQAITQESAVGQCGKFVIDEAAATVRLPKIVMPIQGLTDLASLGSIVSAGLPEIEGLFHPSAPNNTSVCKFGASSNSYTSGAFYLTNEQSEAGAKETDNNWNVGDLGFKASRSNTIYGNSDTVQQEQIQYPYFIQIATGSEAEVNIVNDIELNNPYTLLESKYTNEPLYNLSWLRATGSFEPKATYPKVYEALQVEYNTEIAEGESVQLPSGTTYTKRGLPVKLSGEADITDYDFVINTENETFRLPLLNGSEDLPGYSYETLTAEHKKQYDCTSNGWYVLRATSTANDASITIENLTSKMIDTKQVHASYEGRCTVFARKGDVVEIRYNDVSVVNFRFIKAQGNGTLYYYVGETVQNANLIDAGRITEQLAIKTNAAQAAHAAMPSEKYIDLTLGASGSAYTAPADGYFYFRASNYTSDVSIFNEVRLQYDASTTDNISTTCQGRSAIATYLPIKAGKQVYAYYTDTVSQSVFRFYYAEGAK